MTEHKRGWAMPAATAPPRASVDAGTVAQRFNYGWTEEEHDGLANTYWWYAVSVRVDPNEVIASDDSGDLWAISFTTDGEDGVTFGDAVRVRETYVPVQSSDGSAATQLVARRAQRVLAANLSRPSDRPNPTARANEPHTEENTNMNDRVRAFLTRQGLDPDTATEDQITAAEAFADLPTTETAPEGTEPAAGDDPSGAEPEAAPAIDAPAEPVLAAAASAADPFAAEQARQLAATSAEVVDLRTRIDARDTAETTERRDGLAQTWVADGRIYPAEHDHYRSLLDIDEERTVGLANALAPGRVPLRERGVAHTSTSATGAASTAIGAPTATGWFPQLNDNGKGA